MAKRMVTIFFIALGCCFLLFAMMFIVLFLAPGFSIFGIKYLRAGTHHLNAQNVNIYELVGEGFSGSITFETKEIPINVYFTEKQNDSITNDGFFFTYVDNFEGITTSSFDDPSYSIKKDLVGNVTIKTKEYEKLIFESSTSTRYFNLYIPIEYIDSAAPYDRINLTINAGKAPVTFIKETVEDLRTPAFNKLSITTNGKVDFKTHVYASTYQLTTNNSIEIGENKNIGIEAYNMDLFSKKGAITLKRAIDGDLTAKTVNRNIKIVGCRNLKIETSYGSVSGYGENKISTTGLVNITTKAGDITLGKVDGTGTNKIVTSTGSVSIDSIEDGSLTTSAGAIRIKSVNNFKISTNVGKVIVEQAKTSLDVTTKRGNIVLGGEGMVMSNVSAYSRLGKINVSNASGKVNLQTNQSDITFKNKDSKDITISCGDELVATNLEGKVTISSVSNVNLKFSEISDTTTISLGSECTSAKIEALNNNINNTKYIFSGKNVTIWESNGVGTGSFSRKDVGKALSNPTLTGNFPYIKITGKYVDIVVYFDSSAQI